MITLSIRDTLDANKLADFEALHGPRRVRSNVAVEGSSPISADKAGGATNVALGLIDFPTLADYESYREKLMSDADAVEALRQVEAAGCILIEDRSFVRRVPG